MKPALLSSAGFALLWAFTGCTTPDVTEITPTESIYMEEFTPLAVDGADYETVSFTKVLIQIPPGAPLGRMVMNGVPRQEIPYDGEGIREASANYNLLALEELRSAGYRVKGGESLLFAQDESGKARYAIGGTIRKMYFVVYGDFWWGVPSDAPIELGVTVDWEIYDTLNRKVSHTQTTRGYTKQTGTFPKAMQDSFRAAFRNLLAQSEFSDALKIAASPTPQSNWEPLALTAPAPRDLALPGQMNAALTSVFTVKSGGSHGTGFFLTPDGYALTAAHVVSGLDTVSVTLDSGITLDAEVLRTSHQQDAALLKIKGNGFPGLARGDLPEIGSGVFVVGSPLSSDLAHSVSKGVVSGLREKDGTRYIQTDAAVNFGNSGGPLLAENGQVLGLVSQKISGPGVEGLGFVVPISEVLAALGLHY